MARTSEIKWREGHFSAMFERLGDIRMAGPNFKYPTMSLEEFEQLLLDKPEDEKWELIGGRLIMGIVGARIEHHTAIDNIGLEQRAFNLTQVALGGARCATGLKSAAFIKSCQPSTI